MTLRFWIKPALEIVDCSTTVPWMRAALGIVGYRGTVFSSKFPAITPEEMLSVLRGVCLTVTAGLISVLPIMLLMPSSVLEPAISPLIDGGIAGSFTGL